jgi:AraC-like DNA-binding protein
VPVHRAQALLRGARDAGLDVPGLCRAAGVPHALLGQPRGRLPAAEFAALITSVAAELDDELLGLGPVRMKVGTFAMACHATIHCCPDLRGALARTAQFYRLFDADLGYELVESDGVARLALGMHSPGPGDPIMHESILVVTHRLMNWVIGERIALSAVEFSVARPEHAIEYDLIFGCPVSFDAPRDVLVFDARHLDAPLVRDDDDLAKFLPRAFDEVMLRRPYGETVSTRVRRLVSRRLPSPLELDEAARALRMSEPNLRRRLAEEGTTFTEVRDALRRDLAVDALVRRVSSIEEIAASLGYSEPSAFHRAFRRWTGSTPRSYQRR